MSRPRRCRRVCCLPVSTEFVPKQTVNPGEPVTLLVEEFETLRLIDKEGLSQEECGTYMDISRTTVQQIYALARKKVATALTDGLPLKIEGGEYQLCNGRQERCRFAGCGKHRCAYRQLSQEEEQK